MEIINTGIKSLSTLLITLLFQWLLTAQVLAAPAGYSEFYIPGDEDNMLIVLEEIGTGTQNGPMHAVIGATAWDSNAVIYYDHWEDGYDLDINDLENTFDEKVTLATAGASTTFESAAIPVPRPAVDVTNQCVAGTPAANERNCEYDGRDRIITVGGNVTISRASWDNGTGTVLALAWEVYPVSPLLTTYILPFGEDLAAAGLNDFDRVYALIQATEDNTTVSVNYDGVAGADTLCDRNGLNPVATLTLAEGEVFLLDNTSACTVTSLDTGTRIDGDTAIQVQYIIGLENSQYQIRGLSAFPRGFWSKEYYAPVPGHTNTNTDIYIYNPQTAGLTINWETTGGANSFIVPASSTVSFSGASGAFVPQNSAVYLNASEVFWAVSTIDPTQNAFDWGYSLVPRELLTSEHYLAWAPGRAAPAAGAGADDSGIFITPAQDGIQLYVDYENDGVIDQTYNLNRLQTQYVFDATDGDMSNAHIFATGPYAAAYGQNPDTADINAAIDVGYTMLPSIETITVLKMDKTTDPVVLPLASGSQAVYTLTISADSNNVDNISTVDTLPTGWQYVSGTTTITRADLTTLTAAAADPTGTTTLSWSSTQLGSLAANQNITIQFTAETTQAFNVGDVTRNDSEATGTRTVQGVTQTFTTSDFVFNSYGDLEITKTSNGVDPLAPGDTFTYTVTVTNPGTTTYTNVAIYDPLPAGVSYVAASSQVTTPLSGGSAFVLDTFSVQSYSNNDGTANWSGNWVEVGDDGAVASGSIGVEVNTGFGDGNIFFDQFGNVTPPRSLSRALDARTFASATIEYDYLPSNFSGATPSANNLVEAYISSPSSGQADLLIGSYTTTGGNTGVINIPAAYLTADMTVLFQVAGGYDTGNDDTFAFDNIRIDYTIQSGLVTLAANPPPSFVSASNSYSLGPSETMTLTFMVTVDDPLANGITEITNTGSATATELPVPISASATNIVNNPGAGSATVGERVWLDANGNGVFDVGESGLSNIEVTLRDDFGTPIAVTTTDANGFYSFGAIPAGSNYYVQVTNGLPAGLTLTTTAGPVANSTPTFNLVTGQNYTDANLGFQSTTGATFGDLVWSDDGDGIRQPGEPGLAGITVELWNDVNGDGIFDGGDTLFSTTVSAADGSYLFVGIPATGTEDYFVLIDNTNVNNTGPLTNYSVTTPSIYSLLDNSAGDVILTSDFGFQGTPAQVSDITDRLCIDTGIDGCDIGDSGLAGVTINLLDASLNVIATVTTDANGDFTFTGVADGNYTLQVTDTGNVLADYYGTTTPATAGELAVTLSGGDITAASFGYNLTRSIGDTIFNDLNGDGIQDAGELGIAGVVVELDDGACTLGSTCASVTTDANGQYLFSGLVDGAYIVNVDGTQSALSGFALTTADDGAAGSPHTRNVTIAGGVSQLGIDYGYQATVSRTIGGQIWDDVNQDGVIDGTESGLSNVTVELVNSGGTVVGTATTDGNGDYSFIGQPSGIYTVRVTDANSALNGYTQTYEVDTGVCGTCDGETTADASGADVSGVNFGYSNTPPPTRVTIGKIELAALSVDDFLAGLGVEQMDTAALQMLLRTWDPIAARTAGVDRNAIIDALRRYLDPDGDGFVAALIWDTLEERGTIGFYVERQENAGSWLRVNQHMLPGLITAPMGGEYLLVDPAAQAGQVYRYRLIELEATGITRGYGPYTVEMP